MTDSTARSFNIPLDFLAPGTYEATICEDGRNADRYPSDYQLSSKLVTNESNLSITMASGGGYVVRLKRKE